MIRRPPTSLRGAPNGRLPHPRPTQGVARPPAPDPAPPPEIEAQSPLRAGWTLRLLWAGGFLLIGGGLVWVLWPVLSILVASAALAYLLDPLIDRLEARGISRPVGIGILLVLGVSAGLGFLLLMLPPLFGRFGQVGTLAGEFFATLDQRIAPLAAWVQEHTGYSVPVDLSELQAQAPQLIEEWLPRAQSLLQRGLQGLFTQGMSLVGAVLNLTLLPLFTFYLLVDWDRLVERVASLIPPRLRPRVERVARAVDERLSAFVRGQILVCLALAVLYSLGLWIAGIDLPFTVGTLAGLLFVVPYLGTLVGIVLASALSLLEHGVDQHLLWVLLVFVGVQAIEGYVLTPRIVGEKVGLHPLVVMIALLVGGSLLGVWGMLVAIPVTATLSVLGAEWVEMYRQSRVFQEEP